MNAQNDNMWQQELIKELLNESLIERRRTRRWNIFFRSLFFILIFVSLFYFLGSFGGAKRTFDSHTALIELQGVIEDKGEISADAVLASLNEAYQNATTKGIILRINSPGGSPVQAGIINDEIVRQKKLHPQIPVIAVVEDICASGGYYIAVAADKIYVNKASIIGSIGVLIEGYGFTEAIKKVGIERRLIAAGENKTMLDAFSPVNPKHKAHMQTMLNEVHEQFKSVVRVGRGERLKETPEIFSGLFWTGAQGVKLGLADGLGSTDYVAREIIKESNVIDFTQQDDIANRLVKRFGVNLLNNFLLKFFENISLKRLG
ncbi:MAG: S49 family peptidase [Methylophilaceae bacterium]|nr:S49 family peptidase [Methylophilaceae bacterium]